MKTQKNNPKSIKAIPKTPVKENIPKSFLAEGSSTNRKNNIIAFILIVVLSFVLYSNTIPYEYVLDDKAYITNNQFTTQGIKGIPQVLGADIFKGIAAKENNYVMGGRYRPLSMVMFAIEWSLCSKDTIVDVQEILPNGTVGVVKKNILMQTPACYKMNHFVNILLYAITGLVIFVILSKLFTNSGIYNNTNTQTYDKHWYFSIPFLTTILYLAHPIHTEAVANIKSRDEIMTFMFSLITMWLSMKYLDTKRMKYLVYSFIMFFLALLSKENAITFIALIPLTIYYFVPKENIGWNPNKAKKYAETNIFGVYIRVVAPLLIATVLFLILRRVVIGAPSIAEIKDLMNNPFLNMSFLQQYSTIFYTLGLYIKLMIYPYPLTFDYYPYHIPIVNPWELKAILPLLFYIGMLVYAVFGFKKKTIVSYGIWFYLITLSIVSNVFFPIGAFMSERFVFISSLGFMLIIVYVLVNKLPDFLAKHRTTSMIPVLLTTFAGVVLVIYSVMTITRNTAWKNEYTLFTTDVNVSQNSAKGNYAAGFAYYSSANLPENAAKKKELLEKSIAYLEKALVIHPKFENVLLFLGNVQYEYNNDYKKSIEYYLRVLEMYPTYEKVFDYVSWMFTNNKEPIPDDYKMEVYSKLYSYNQNRFDVVFNLGFLYLKVKNEPQKAMSYLQKAQQFQPNNSDVYKIMGVAQTRLADYQNAIQNFEKGIQLNPRDSQLYYNLGVMYQQMGDQQKANQFLLKAQQVGNNPK